MQKINGKLGLTQCISEYLSANRQSLELDTSMIDAKGSVNPVGISVMFLHIKILTDIHQDTNENSFRLWNEVL